MAIDPDKFGIINWHWLSWRDLSPEQLRTYRTHMYSDESCTVRTTSTHRAIDSVMQTLTKPDFQIGTFTEACRVAKSACLTGFADNLRRMGQHDSGFDTAIVCLRIASRIEAISKKIVQGGAQSIATALAPYAVTDRSSLGKYTDLQLYFKTEAEFKDDLAALYLEKSKEVFTQSSNHYFDLLKIIDSLNVYPRAELCASFLLLIKENNVPHLVVDFVKKFPEWKDTFPTVFFVDNISWLREKKMLHPLKKELPEDALLILEKEEEFLQLERKIQEHKMAIQEAKAVNEFLAEARQFWSQMRAEKKSDVDEVQEGKATHEIPNELLCPITQEVMKDPVITEAGIVYDRTAIEIWLATKNTDPMTRKVLTDKKLIPVHPFKSLIESFMKRE